MKLKFNGFLVLLVVLVAQITFAQERAVTGVVSDNAGMPLPGVSVLVKGTQSGTQTDFDGKFSIKATPSQVLLFSFVGMKTQQIPASSTKINVKLQNDSTVLEEVVVSGAVGIKKKKAAITSSYSTVSSDELKTAYNPDVVRSLAGKVSGLTINATTNGVSGSNSIRIRSMLSFTGNTEALVVIDNIISTSDVLANLPPEMIEDVTVLKGAQGAALYGSQGKQGVVLVQTKKGSNSDKMSVTFTSSYDNESISFVPERQTNYGQGWYGGRDPQENGGWGDKFDGAPYVTGIPGSPLGDVNTTYSSKGSDNIKEFYTQGTIFQNNLNINVGSNDSYINFNLGNLSRNFILEGDKLNRNSFVFNAGKKINKLTLAGNLTFTNQNTQQANVNAATSRSDYTLLTNLLMTSSGTPVEAFKDRGIYGWNGYYQNPYWAKDNNRLIETRNYVNIGGTAKYEINKNIELSYNGALQLRNNDQISYANEFVAASSSDSQGTSSGSEFYQSVYGSTNYYSDMMANFNYELTDKIGMKFNVGENIQYNFYKRVSQGGSNLDIAGFYNINNVLNPASPSSMNNSAYQTRSVATFANFDFNYEDYLFLNFTGRYEGNSVASVGNQFYFYPSVGASFIPTKAIAAIKDNKVLTNLKVYANYTKVGSLDPVGAYELTNLASSATGYPFATGAGNSYNDSYSITDPNIKPETYTTYEGGLNFGFFKNIITLDVSGYLTNTKDLITNASLGYSTGLQNKKTNSGELQGKGIEIDLGFMPINTTNFKWNGRFSFTSYDTKVINSGESDKVTITDSGNSQINADISAVKGLSFPYITGTDWIRDSSGNVIIDATGQPTPTSTFQNLGKVTPDYILGFTNSFQYKNIGLSFTMDYRTGNYFISQTKYNLTWTGHLADSGEFDRNVGFLYPGSVMADPANPGKYIPNTTLTGGGMYNSGTANRTQTYYGMASNLGSHNMIDGTAFKVREIALSYSLPKEILKKVGIETFKLSVNARNPFIILASGNRGYADPEASNQVNTSTSTAAKNATGTLTNTSRNGLGWIGDAQYPSTRTFGFSLNTTF